MMEDRFAMFDSDYKIGWISSDSDQLVISEQTRGIMQGIESTLLSSKFKTHELLYFAGQGSSPEWNEKFTFRVEYPGADNQYKLVLKIMDHDTFSTDDYLGQATIYLEDFLALGVENGTAELHPRKYRVVGSNQVYNGEIQVGITFTPKVSLCFVQAETSGEAFGGWKESNYY
ncbi:hypothetical protein RJ639_024449 [Escallonia herrerae]|uniref:C2 domain-containing protein n=1 Tax=Escallonia herrerae TaxID=1293975 RepID=A0AA89ADT1_9ASTE|nr:hypothetical protein RJ639_024449 [Escallonia herrerae]